MQCIRPQTIITCHGSFINTHWGALWTRIHPSQKKLPRASKNSQKKRDCLRCTAVAMESTDNCIFHSCMRIRAPAWARLPGLPGPRPTPQTGAFWNVFIQCTARSLHVFECERFGFIDHDVDSLAQLTPPPILSLCYPDVRRVANALFFAFTLAQLWGQLFHIISRFACVLALVPACARACVCVHFVGLL